VTALVTGASAGLGAAFARALAREGRDLVLTARRADRLDALAAELGGVAVDTVAVDLVDPDGPDRLMAELARRGIAVDLLVNNAGFGLRGPFAERERAAQTGVVDVNCRAVVALAHAVLPPMLDRGRGAILNVASTAAFQAGPWMATYYASKAFVLSFSEALHEEVRGRGVTVTALCPGPTRTEFAARAGMDDIPAFHRFAVAPEKVVADGLAALRAGQAVRVSGVANRLAALSTRFAPRALTRRVAGSLQRMR
jgi:uncharacterized protein